MQDDTREKNEKEDRLVLNLARLWSEEAEIAVIPTTKDAIARGSNVDGRADSAGK